MGMFLELVLISLVTPIGSCNCMGMVSILRNTIVQCRYSLSNNSVTVCCVNGSSIFVPLVGFCQLQRCLFCIMPFILKASSLCFLSGSCHHFLCFWSLPSCQLHLVFMPFLGVGVPAESPVHLSVGWVPTWMLLRRVILWVCAVYFHFVLIQASAVWLITPDLMFAKSTQLIPQILL